MLIELGESACTNNIYIETWDNSFPYGIELSQTIPAFGEHPRVLLNFANGNCVRAKIVDESETEAGSLTINR